MSCYLSLAVNPFFKPATPPFNLHLLTEVFETASVVSPLSQDLGQIHCITFSYKGVFKPLIKVDFKPYRRYQLPFLMIFSYARFYFRSNGPAAMCLCRYLKQKLFKTNRSRSSRFVSLTSTKQSMVYYVFLMTKGLSSKPVFL